MSELVPELRQISVAPTKLILDPNNPRLISREEEEESQGDALDLLDSTISRMRARSGKNEEYKISELENSIIQNGWCPVDFIFVRKLDTQGHYLVLEGNRRVTAIRNLLNDRASEIKPELLDQLEQIEVMEIIDDLPEDEIRKKVTYLLGVRHHGSLKKWTPFAQAYNIYKRYLELLGVEPSDFIWQDDIGSQVADALSISEAEVKDRLQVFRVMEQVGNHPTVLSAGDNGGMKDRYYSVCAEVLLTGSKVLKEYIKQSDSTFLLDDPSQDRMINLCHFDLPARREAPINNPQEWRKLASILADEDSTKRAEMLQRVEGDEKVRPSIVWAERSAELQKLRWDTWLASTLTVVRGIRLEDDLTSDEALNTTKRLLDVLSDLQKRDQN